MPLRRRQFEAYLDKVFAWSARVAALPEGRKHPRQPGRKVWDAVFLGAALQLPNIHQVEAACRAGVLQGRIGSLSEDTMGYALERQDPSQVFRLGCEVARRLKRNGLLRSEWARGRVVAAVDGIEICHSFSRCCAACLVREVEHKVRGEMRREAQYYHRLVAVVVVSAAFPIPLGIRFQSPGETEVACGLELLGDLEQHLGRRFLDVLVGDALYLQQGAVKAIEARPWEWVFTVKENQPELLAEAQRRTSGPPITTVASAPEELQVWHAPETYWPVARRSVRIVKTVRKRQRRRVQVANEAAGKRVKSKQVIWEEATNFYATNLELGLIPPRFVADLGRSRWRIDAEVFQTLTTQAHLKRPSLHQPHALVVLTMIRVLAYTLSLVFYHRQIVSHCRPSPPSFSETARLLAGLCCPPRLDSS